MKSSSIAGAPQTVTLANFQSRLADSEKSGLASKVNQLGINMVDLMMWLVIAALLLAAALQGIGFYQKAAWNYQLKSDADAVRTYQEAQYTLNNNVYPSGSIKGAVAPVPPATVGTAAADYSNGQLKLTADGGVGNEVVVTTTATGGWQATVCSKALQKAGVAQPAIQINSANPQTATPATCA